MSIVVDANLVAALVIELPPLQVAFKTVSLTLLDWGMILGVSLAASIWIEAGKLLRHTIFNAKSNVQMGK